MINGEYTPGNLVGHGNRLWEVRRANVAFIALVSRSMRSNVDLTYIAK
jgi:hypothetical protein